MNSLAHHVYITAQAKPGSRQSLRRQLQHYADLVICPRMQRHPSKGQLDAHRLYAAQCLISAWPKLALDLAQMANAAPRELPFSFTALDAFRIALDQQHALAKAGQ